MYIDSYEMINEAIELAAKAHKDQTRKGSDTPYIVHPFEVALILKENNADNDVIIAGILHDVLEDTDVEEEEIRSKFGDEILNLVLGASEVLKGRKNRPWKDRKSHTIKYLKTAPMKAKILACADKLSNLRSMIKGYKLNGDQHWNNFNAPYREQKWYYENLVESLKDLDGYKMYEEFKEGVVYLFSRGSDDKDGGGEKN